MGLIICTKHGKRGLLPVCTHIERAVREGNGGAVIPEKIELYWGPDDARPELYFYVCSACGEKVRSHFGTAMIRDQAQWEACLDLAGDGGGVCASCFCDIYPDTRESP